MRQSFAAQARVVPLTRMRVAALLRPKDVRKNALKASGSCYMKSQDQSSELWQLGTHVPGVAVKLTTDALFVKGLSVGTMVGVGDVKSIIVKNVVPL